MEVKVDEECAYHKGMLKTFKCYSCNVTFCPLCLTSHPKHPAGYKLIRTEAIGHFLTYGDSNYSYTSPHEIVIWIYNIAANKMTYKSLSTHIFEQESILIQNKIYLLGGLTSMSGGTIAKAYNEMYVYDIKTEAGLTALPSMPFSAFGSAVCTTNDLNIYTVGGKNEAGYTNSCAKYIIGEKRWVSLKPISVARANVSLGVFNCEKIYCIGGCINGGFSNIFEVMDTQSDGNPWVKLAVTLERFTARSGMAVIQNPITNNLMLFGGCTDIGITADVMVFNVKTNAITKLDSKIPKMTGFVMRQPAVYNDCYYLFEYGRNYDLFTYSFKDNKDHKVDVIPVEKYIPDAGIRASKLS